RVDHLQRRDVDEHTARAGGRDARRQIVLQREREVIAHIYLNRHQEVLAHLQDGNALERHAFFVATLRPSWRIAMANASASVALVMTFDRSTPRCTMVCAICGRMPETMHSAPIRRAAATVLRRCCATSVSTVGTPVMSMMAISELVSTMRWSSVSI